MENWAYGFADSLLLDKETGNMKNANGEVVAKAM